MAGTDDAAAGLFRRMVLGLHASAAPGLLETAVRYAQRFESELSGVYFEDPRLLEWAAAPLGRQFSRACTPAHPASAEHAACEFSAAAALLRGRLRGVAQRLGVAARFEVARGRPGDLDLSALGIDDLWAVLEPSDPLARMSYPFTRLQAMVASLSSPVLYLPHGATERAGPVLAILAGEPADAATAVQRASRGVAAQVARRLRADLVGVAAGDPAVLAGIARREQLIVLSRSLAFAPRDGDIFTRCAQRGVPLLLVGPPSAED